MIDAYAEYLHALTGQETLRPDMELHFNLL